MTLLAAAQIKLQYTSSSVLEVKLLFSENYKTSIDRVKLLFRLPVKFAPGI